MILRSLSSFPLMRVSCFRLKSNPFSSAGILNALMEFFADVIGTLIGASNRGGGRMFILVSFYFDCRPRILS